MNKIVPAITLVRAQYPDRSLHDRVVHKIGRKILGGELPPGALLPAQPELAAVAQALAEMGRTAQGANGDFEPFVQADMRFHLAILHACRNELLEQMSRIVYSALLVSFRATSRLPGRARGSLPKHRAILEAIRARSPRGAAAAMRRLVQTTAREVEAMGRRPRARRP